MRSDTDEAIRMRAFEIWQQEGFPVGRDREHWLQAERELGLGPADLDRNPGIGTSAGTSGSDPEEIAGENTSEGDVMNDVGLGGGIDPDQRGRTNK